VDAHMDSNRARHGDRDDSAAMTRRA
jgi:hypothetical protein